MKAPIGGEPLRHATVCQPAPVNTSPVVIAIPVKDAAERLGACLTALNDQQGVPASEIVLLLNNCTDGSEAVAGEIASRTGAKLHVLGCKLPAHLASAEYARHLAMQRADEIALFGTVLMTTDADSVAPPLWIARNLDALRGADAVAGRAVIDPRDALLIPARLHEDYARECAFAALLDEIASLLDPDPADPWPRHDERSRASIAVRAEIFRAVGGMPSIPSGEDRAFFDSLRAIDARVRHEPEVWVTVSGRIEKRAAGGMADYPPTVGSTRCPA